MDRYMYRGSLFLVRLVGHPCCLMWLGMLQCFACRTSLEMAFRISV